MLPILPRRNLGYSVLAVSYDFPFMVDLARKNTQAVCEHLGLDLLIVKSRNNLEYNFERNNLISLAATGTTWGQCTFCHYGIEAVLYETARSREIPFILSGVTNNEVWWNPGNRLSILAKRLKELSFEEKFVLGSLKVRLISVWSTSVDSFPYRAIAVLMSIKGHMHLQMALKQFRYLTINRMGPGYYRKDPTGRNGLAETI